MIFNPSIAAEANMGGNDAEKQYPAPDSLCNIHTNKIIIEKTICCR